MPTIETGKNPRDATGRFFMGIWDAVAGHGLAWRGGNSDGQYADGRVILYDASGNPLLFDSPGKARTSLYAKAVAAGDTAVLADTAGRLYARTWIAEATAPATIVIATSTTISIAVDARGYSGFGLVIPSTFNGSTISFQVSVDNSTYQALYDSNGDQVTMTNLAASRSYDLPGELSKWPYFKIVAGTAQADTDTNLIVAMRA